MDIATERLFIRKFTYDDWQAVHAYTADANVMNYIPEGIFSDEDAKKFVIENSNENPKYFPVLLKKDQTLIGHIAFHLRRQNGDRCGRFHGAYASQRR